MDITLPRLLPTGMGNIGIDAASKVAQAGRSALPTPSLGAGAALSALGTQQAAIPSLSGIGSLTGSAGAGSVGVAGVAGVDGVAGVAGVDGTAPAQNVVQSFSSVLSQALQDINQTQSAADSDAAKLAAGEPVDLHQVMIGMESANLSFGLALQVRNKLLDAYQEVMRMVI